MQLGTFRDPEVLYEEEPEGRSNAQSVRLHSQGAHPPTVPQAPLHSPGSKRCQSGRCEPSSKIRLTNLCLTIRTTTKRCEKTPCWRNTQTTASYAETIGPHSVRSSTEKGRGEHRVSSDHDQLTWHTRHPKPSDPRVETASQRRCSRLARHVRGPDRVDSNPGCADRTITETPMRLTLSSTAMVRLLFLDRVAEKTDHTLAQGSRRFGAGHSLGHSNRNSPNSSTVVKTGQRESVQSGKRKPQWSVPSSWALGSGTKSPVGPPGG